MSVRAMPDQASLELSATRVLIVNLHRVIVTRASALQLFDITVNGMRDN